MMSDVVLQIPEDLAQHAHQLSKNEVGILITLFSLTDKWPRGTASDERQKSHAQVLRWHLQSLFDYYYALSQENKAKLVATLHGTTFYVENEGLTHGQIATIQTLLTYLQRVTLTVDDLRTSSGLLWENGIDTTPAMSNWQAAIANH